MSAPEFPTGDRADLSDLEPWWSRIAEKYERHVNDQDDGQVLTSRRFDRAQPAGNRAYVNAGRYLNVAHENHVALHALLEHHGLSPWATYNLVRPTFEAAFFALWILDPTDGVERRVRGLRVEWQDQRERWTCLGEYEALPQGGRRAADMIADHKANVTPTYQGEAIQLGIDWDTIKRSVNVRDELGKLSISRGDRDLTVLLRATWRTLSGVQHGYAYPSLLTGDIVRTVPIPGGQEAVVTVNDDAFVFACTMTAFLFESALNRWAELSK